jgi:cation diffusion facilitator family transporter|tara:strand:- start:307 stop:1218 length:912 start_codon:yes stop_codon:yes gene_type:complete
MSSNQGSSAKAILYAFIANFGIAIAKFAAAIYTSSGSMLAEAIHSVADTCNQVLLFIGLRSATKPADSEHPLGYGKLSYFWSFIVALLLFSVGGVFSIYEGFHKLQAPEALTDAWVGLLVLGASIIIEIGSLLGALREVRKMRGERALFEWLKTTRNAEMVVVLGEDSAAIVGLIVAFVFVLLSSVTGNVTYDAVGSICIGVVLIVVAIFVAIRIQSLLVGRSAEPDLQRLLQETIVADDLIEEVLNTITMQFGPKVMLAAKIRMRNGIPIEQVVAGINSLERVIRERFPEIGWCFIEPDNAS